MQQYQVAMSARCARVYRDGIEVAQAIPTETGVYYATCVRGEWVGHEHETGLTLDSWASRFTN